jgi:hypothetical protein
MLKLETMKWKRWKRAWSCKIGIIRGTQIKVENPSGLPKQTINLSRLREKSIKETYGLTLFLLGLQ